MTKAYTRRGKGGRAVRVRASSKRRVRQFGKLRRNTTGNVRSGKKFRLARVGGNIAHVYGKGKNRKVVVVRKVHKPRARRK